MSSCHFYIGQHSPKAIFSFLLFFRSITQSGLRLPSFVPHEGKHVKPPKNLPLKLWVIEINDQQTTFISHLSINS